VLGRGSCVLRVLVCEYGPALDGYQEAASISSTLRPTSESFEYLHLHTHGADRFPSFPDSVRAKSHERGAIVTDS